MSMLTAPNDSSCPPDVAPLSPTDRSTSSTSSDAMAPPADGAAVAGEVPAAAPAAGRDRAVDLVRAVALLRVVTYHAIGLPYVMTWFSAMPLMFFIAGYFTEASLERERPAICVRKRFVRVLLPLAPYALTIVGVFVVAGYGSQLRPANVVSYFVPLLSFPGPSGPVAVSEPLGWTFMGLWYLQNYLLFVLISPVLRWGLRRSPWAVGLAVAALWVVMLRLGVGDRFAVYLAAWTFGMVVFRRPALAGARKAWTWVFGGALVLGSTVFFTLTAPHPSPAEQRWGVVSVLLLGMAWIAGSLAFKPQLQALAERRIVAPVVRWLNARAVSVYLWHFAAFGLSAAIARVLLGPGWSIGHGVVSLALAAGLTFVFATAFGWLEDVAARRRPQLIPGRRRRTSTSVDRRPPVPSAS